MVVAWTILNIFKKHQTRRRNPTCEFICMCPIGRKGMLTIERKGFPRLGSSAVYDIFSEPTTTFSKPVSPRLVIASRRIRTLVFSLVVFSLNPTGGQMEMGFEAPYMFFHRQYFDLCSIIMFLQHQVMLSRYSQASVRVAFTFTLHAYRTQSCQIICSFLRW